MILVENTACRILASRTQESQDYSFSDSESEKQAFDGFGRKTASRTRSPRSKLSIDVMESEKQPFELFYKGYRNAVSRTLESEKHDILMEMIIFRRFLCP